MSEFETDPDHQAGFSLLDALIALIIMSIAAGIMSGFLVQLKQIDRQSDGSQIRQNATIALDHLSNTLSSAQSTPYRFSETGTQVIFSGSSSRVSFTAPVRIRSNTYALRKVTFSLKSENGALQMTTSPILQDDEDRIANTRSNVILKNVQALQFKYMNQDSNWLTNWPAGIVQPPIVSIAVRLSSDPEKTLERIVTLRRRIHRNRTR